jgi:CheY-like chemotaxis protein
MNLGDRILIIDDDKLFLDTYRDILEPGGYTVETALDRATGSTMLESGEWDVVLVDNKLSGEAGPDRRGLGPVARRQGDHGDRLCHARVNPARLRRGGL